MGIRRMENAIKSQSNVENVNNSQLILHRIKKDPKITIII